ncbi:MAG: hypothetical protein IPM58_09600 [Nitrospira sp.]|nr:hypothetical protein [Nitrospira sp.]
MEDDRLGEAEIAEHYASRLRILAWGDRPLRAVAQPLGERVQAVPRHHRGGAQAARSALVA